ncbi:MAG: YndJ family transporter [Bacteroidota bacterium]
MINRRHLLPYLLIAVIVLIFLPIQSEWAETWLYRILLMGPLLVVPVGIQILAERFSISISLNYLYSFISALLLLLVAYSLPADIFAAALSLPWLLFTILFALFTFRNRQFLPLASVLAASFLPVAAAWMTADRLGWQPLGFDPVIVLLTGIHFHYAGFALASLTALLPNSIAKRYLSIGLLPGVAGVAIGITSTQLAGPAWIEIMGVTTMVTVGIGVAIQQLRVAWRTSTPVLISLLLSFGSIALAGGLSLALLYGWRFHYQWEWLTIPWMYATHGLLNSLGFTLFSFLGHYQFQTPQ